MLFAFVLSAAAADSFIQADRDRLTRIEATQNAPSPIGEGLGWGFK
jgi:hypothetical protein